MIGTNLNEAIDRIMEERCSVRQFLPESPSKEMIKLILHAGLCAPHGALATQGKEHRRFFVVEKDSPIIGSLKELMQRKAARAAEQLSHEMNQNPFLKQHAAGFLKRLKFVSENGPAGVGTAPYYIVVAERKGIPAVEQKSLSHALQNMWLKATALGLGFHLLTLTSQMSDEKEFCDLLRIPFGQFQLDGCCLGFPAYAPSLKKRAATDDLTTWFH